MDSLLLGYGDHMVVRIRWSAEQIPRASQLALAAVSLLMPLALLAFSLALWGFCAELEWTGHFAVTRGWLAHWQVWLSIAAVLLLTAKLLGLLGRGFPPAGE